MKTLSFGLLFFLITIGSLAAQTQDEETLKPVEVTATRLKDVEEKISRIPGKIVVITKDDIEKLGARTVQEILQYQTGIVLYDQIGNEFQSTVDLRGFNGQPVPATTIFVDGVRVNEPDFNTINFDLIPVDEIDRIEIRYGPGPLFGRNSLAGVINIRTKRGQRDEPHFEAEIGGGSYNRQKYRFNSYGPLPIPNLDYYLGVTRELSGGFRKVSEGRITRLFTKVGYSRGSSTDIVLSYARTNDRLKQAGSVDEPTLRRDRRANISAPDISDGSLHLVTLNVRQTLPVGLSLAANGFYRKHTRGSFVTGLSSVIDGRFGFSQGGGTVQLTHDGRIFTRKNTMNLGVEYNRNRFSNRTDGSFSGFPFSTRRFTTENVVGVYLLNVLDIIESLSVTGGFRYDWDRLNFRDDLTPAFDFRNIFQRVSPTAGITYNPFPNLGFYFNYSEGFRPPTVAELPAFNPPTFTPTVSDLDPVKSRNFEVGVRGNLGSGLEGSLAFFYMPVRDEILFVVTDPATFAGRNSNISRSLRKGIELTLKSRYGKMIDGFLNYSYTKATFETDVLLFSGQVKKGDEFPLVPNHRVGMGVNLHPVDKLTLSLFGNYVGSQYLLGDESNHARKLDDYFVLNGKVSYDYKMFTWYLSLNNMTNANYTSFGILGGFPVQPFLISGPKTTFFTGLKFRYN